MIKIANTPSELIDNIDEALMQFLQTDNFFLYIFREFCYNYFVFCKDEHDFLF